MALSHDGDISQQVIASAIEVHRGLGPGLLESIYERALALELRGAGCEVQTQVDVPVFYREQNLGIGLRLDLLVANRIVVEVKSVASLDRLHQAQLLTYLRVCHLRTGLLINFNCVRLTDGLKRVSL